MLTDKVPDIANIIAGAIVIAFAIGQARVSWQLLVAGMAFWAAALAFAVTIAERK